MLQQCKAVFHTDSYVSYIVVLQLLNCVQLCKLMNSSTQAPLSPSSSWNLLKFVSVESVVQSTHLILCHLVLLLPSVFPSITVFSNELALCIRWPKWWSFTFSISSSSAYSRLISFRIDWFSLLAVQGTLKSLLQHHNSKVSILQHTAFFLIQFSHPYMTMENSQSIY